MVITPYQVKSVLRVYGDQLRQNRLSARAKTRAKQPPEKVSISAGARRKAIIDKIASDVVEKITHYGPSEKAEKEVFRKLEDEYGNQLKVANQEPNELVFKVIDEDGETVKSLSLEDSKFLTRKLEEITKETIDKNMA
jgi:hypothetical protein